MEGIDEIKIQLFYNTFPSNIVTKTGIIKELEMGNMVIDILHTQEYLAFAHHAIEDMLAMVERPSVNQDSFSFLQKKYF